MQHDEARGPTRSVATAPSSSRCCRSTGPTGLDATRLDGGKDDVRPLQALLAAWRPAIETALFAHHEPCAEALAAGGLEESDATLPRIAAPGEVWPHVSLEFVAVTPLDGVLTTELGYTSAWDEEHTLGARFRAGRFIELCGSVLPP